MTTKGQIPMLSTPVISHTVQHTGRQRVTPGLLQPGQGGIERGRDRVALETDLADSLQSVVRLSQFLSDLGVLQQVLEFRVLGIDRLQDVRDTVALDDTAGPVEVLTIVSDQLYVDTRTLSTCLQIPMTLA